MKFNNSAIPTPPKGFQTMFQLWLLSYTMKRDWKLYTLESPNDHIFRDEMFYLNDTGSIQVIRDDCHALYHKQDHWHDYINQHLSCSVSEYLPVDSSAIAVEIPGVASGVRWHVVSNPEIALELLGRDIHLTQEEERLAMALIRHYCKDDQEFMILQSRHAGPDFIKKAIKHLQTEENDFLCRNAPPESGW